MELSTILLIYLVVAFFVSITCVIWCVVEDDFDMDSVIGTIFLSSLWPVAFIPFFAMVIFQRLKYSERNK